MDATDPIRRVSVVSTGKVQIRPEARKLTDRRAGVSAPGPDG
jgi:hypothetical protein